MNRFAVCVLTCAALTGLAACGEKPAAEDDSAATTDTAKTGTGKKTTKKDDAGEKSDPGATSDADSGTSDNAGASSAATNNPIVFGLNPVTGKLNNGGGKRDVTVRVEISFKGTADEQTACCTALQGNADNRKSLRAAVQEVLESHPFNQVSAADFELNFEQKLKTRLTQDCKDLGLALPLGTVNVVSISPN